MNESVEVRDVHAEERERSITIVVNGRQKVVHEKELSFDEVVRLAFDNPPTGDNVVITVTYSHAAGPKPAGSMVEGNHVKVHDGTIFNVTATDKS